MDPLIKTALQRTLSLLVWASLSAWLFVAVENTGKDESKEKYKLLHSLYKSMAFKYNMSIEEFNNFSSVAHEALSEPKLQWTFLAAFEFVMTSFTTIGYGWLTPQTPTGQLLCIFVSLIGIPVTLLTLNSIGELIARRVNGIIIKVEEKVLKRAEPKRVKIKSALLLIIGMVVFITALGFWLGHLENWTLLEGVYFAFVTFSTIGFGDYMTKANLLQSTNKLNKLSYNISAHQESKDESVDTEEYALAIFHNVAIMLNCLFGLCVVSSVINSIMESLEEIKRYAGRCPCCLPRDVEDHGNEEQNNIPDQLEMEATRLSMQHLQT